MRPALLTLILLAAAAGVLAMLSVVASGQSTVPARFDDVVRDDLFAGLRGDAVRLARAMKTCDEALARDPSHAEALVWHGAGLMVQARLAFERGDAEAARALGSRGVREMEAA